MRLGRVSFTLGTLAAIIGAVPPAGAQSAQPDRPPRPDTSRDRVIIRSEPPYSRRQ